MRITYTGKQVELTPLHRKKLEARFGKLGKMIDGKEEREAHVVVTAERRMQKAEVTVQYYGHLLVGIGSSSDLFTALTSAVERLEKQLLKTRTKWRDSKRSPEAKLSAVAARGSAKAAEAEPGPAAPRIVRVTQYRRSKPMTLDEALLEMDSGRDYLAYRDAESDKLSVLVRQKDGRLALIES